MVESGKRANIVLWTGLAAATAGIVAVAMIVKWKDHAITRAKESSHLRDVQDVLADCYEKIREIEKRIPDARMQSGLDRTIRAANRSLANNKPAIEQ